MNPPGKQSSTGSEGPIVNLGAQIDAIIEEIDAVLADAERSAAGADRPGGL